MSAINLRLPASLHKSVRAPGEKVSALMAEDYLAERAKRASKTKFLKAMAKVPKVEPDARDKGRVLILNNTSCLE